MAPDGLARSARGRPDDRKATAVRILVWSPQGHTRSYSGAGLNAASMYGLADPAVASVRIVHAADEQDGVVAPALISERVGRLHDWSAAEQARFLLTARGWLRAHRRSFDVFHGLGGFETTMRPALWAEAWGIPAVVKPANHLSNFAKPGRISRMLGLARRRRAALRRLSGVIAISAEIEHELLSYGVPRGRIHRIPNGVRIDRFRPPAASERRGLRARIGVPDGAVALLFVGAVGPRKQPHVLIRPLADLERAGHDVHLWLVGPVEDEAYERALRQEASELGVAGRVHFEGMQSDVRAWYGAADVFALPSRNEGMANAVLEAMASGLPVVASDVSGMRELVQDGVSGVVVGAEGAYAPALSRLVASGDLRTRMGAEARRRSVGTFSADVVLARHLDVFASLRPLP